MGGKVWENIGRVVMEKPIPDISEDVFNILLQVWNQNGYELLRNRHRKKEITQDVVKKGKVRPTSINRNYIYIL